MSEIDLTWTASTVPNSTIASYSLYRQVDAGGFSLLTVTPGNILSFNDTDVSSGHTYQYYVIAQPVTGFSSTPSNTVTESLAGSLWTQVTTAPDFSITDIAVVSSTVVVAGTSNGNVLYSHDGGATWTYVSGPLPAFTIIQSLATDGTVVVASGRDIGSVFVVGISNDGGVTWSQVTLPVGLTGIDPLVYVAGHFVVFDNAVAKVWSSPDGTTWTSHVLSQRFFPGNWVTPKDGFAIGAGRGVWVGNNQANSDGLAVTTTDGVSFTLTLVNAVKSFNSLSFDGTVFNGIGPQGGGPIYGVTSPDGITWTLVANGPPPDEAWNTALAGVGIMALNPFTLSAEISTDHGVTYTTVTPTTSLTFFNNNGSDGTRAFILADGIIGTPDMSTFADELQLPGGNITAVRSGSGLTFSYGNNGTNAAIWQRSSP